MRGEAATTNRVPPVLPLRAMTAGEVLDTAAALLRQRALPLFLLAAPLAAGEQLLLAPMREQAGIRPPFYGPYRDDLGGWWTTTVTGLSLETVIIALLAGYAGAAVGPALLGRRVRHRDLWRRTRPAATIPAALLLGVFAWPAAFLGLLPWLVVYGLFGMTTAALTVDRSAHPFAAMGRSARLAVRSGMRAVGIGLLGYLTWYAVRFALGSGWLAVADQVASVSSGTAWLSWAVPAAWALANTVAYAALACVAAVLLVDTRIRTEALDIVIGRSRARGEDAEAFLVNVS